MRKMLLALILLSTIAFAQQAISDALCSLQRTTQTMMAMATMLFVVLAIPLVGAGIYLYVKKNPNKGAGIALIVIGIILPVIFGVIYLLTPVIISALVGGGTELECY